VNTLRIDHELTVATNRCELCALIDVPGELPCQCFASLLVEINEVASLPLVATVTIDLSQNDAVAHQHRRGIITGYL
jgi:hypothetical protein